MKVTADSKIAVCGAGVMGSGIAQIAAASGHDVVVFDPSADALDKGRAGMAKGLARQVERGKMAAAEAEALQSRIEWSGEMASLAGAALVVEAIIEDAAAKAGLFAAVAAIVGADCILASNTSSLSIERLASAVPVPQRFLGLHFFNPVPVMKLVEVIPATQTAAELADAMIALMQQWGKKPAKVRDVPGFIVNRVARPYYAEAFAALGDGVPPEAIDTALESAGGFRMGPLTLTDMIGQDINFAVAAGVFEGYGGKARFRLQEAQRALAEGGRLGRKSGEGVYSYPEGRALAPAVAPAEGNGPIAIATDRGLLAPVADALAAAGFVPQADGSLAPGTMRFGGITLAAGDGRSLVARGDVDVLVDHIRYPDKAETVAIGGTNERSLGIAAGLLSLIGKTAVAVPDRPGQIVLRTLAQLANAAADAVADGVASAADIDMAMQFGANHPEGPLAWAERYGAARLAAALANIATETGEAMYSPAGTFRACA